MTAAATDSVRGQTTHYGMEPNQTKAQATRVVDVEAGDVLVTSLPFPSYFRVRTAGAPSAIRRYELWPRWGTGTQFVRGRDAQPDSVDPLSDVALQTMGGAPTLDGFLAWYGFGKSEEVMVDIELSQLVQPRFIFPGHSDFLVTPVLEHDLGALPEQPLDLVVRSPLGGHDLEVHVFGAAYDALPYAALDSSQVLSTDVRLPFDAPPGIYHIAVMDHEGASHLAPSALDLVTSSRVLDLAGAVVCSSNSRNVDVDVALEPAGGGAPLARMTATKVLAFEVLWFRLQIGQGQSLQTYCAGDGSALSCGCLGNAPERSGMGCVNSTGRGATVLALDHLQRGQWRVTLEDLPAHTLALAFVGLQSATPGQAFGGLSCIAPGAVRVGPAQADAAGTAVVPAYVPTAGGFLAGQTLYLQAVYRDAVAPGGCMLNFTNGFCFVAR